ncbi:MAG: GGDEF domain-containing protein [Pseudomonadota bacterium]
MQWISFATASVNITIAAMFFGGWAMTRHRVLFDFAIGYALYTVAFAAFAFQSYHPLIVNGGNIAMVFGTLSLAFGLARRAQWQLSYTLCLTVAAAGIIGELVSIAASSITIRHFAIYGSLGLITYLGARAGHRAQPKDVLEKTVVYTLYAIAVILLTNPRFLTGMFPALVPFEFAQSTWAFYATLWIILSQLLAGSLIALAMRDVIKSARHEAVVDPLSGLLNRRGFTAFLKRPHRDDDRAALVMIDIDHFKAINDKLGHDVGDDAIAMVGEVLSQVAPKGSCCARLGGEEFAVLINNGGLALAQRTALAIHSAIDATRRPLDFTVSIGIGDGSHDVLYSRADKALYEAKTTGRNRTCVWQEDDGGTEAARLVNAALAGA